MRPWLSMGLRRCRGRSSCGASPLPALRCRPRSPSWLYRERVSIQKLWCNEVYYTDACILLVNIVLCSKTHCIKSFELKLFSCKIEGLDPGTYFIEMIFEMTLFLRRIAPTSSALSTPLAILMEGLDPGKYLSEMTFIIIGWKLIRSLPNLIRAGNPFTIPNSFGLKCCTFFLRRIAPTSSALSTPLAILLESWLGPN